MHPIQTNRNASTTVMIMAAGTYGYTLYKRPIHFVPTRDHGLVSHSREARPFSTARRYRKSLAYQPLVVDSASSIIPRWLVPQDEPPNEVKESSSDPPDPPPPSSSSPKGKYPQPQQKPILSIGGGGRYFFWYLVSFTVSCNSLFAVSAYLPSLLSDFVFLLNE